MPPKFPPARHIDPRAAMSSDDDDDEEEVPFDLVEVMNEMDIPERRKVYALQGLFNDFKTMRNQMRDEIAQLQIQHMTKLGELFATRHAIVSGERDVTDDEVPAAAVEAAEAAADKKDEKKKGVTVVAPSDEKVQAALAKAASDPHGGIPNFWMTAMSNCEVLDGMITERDRDALSHLVNITSEYIEGHPHKGVTLNFTFSPNAYFTDSVLTKTYKMAFNEDDGDVEIDTITGCDIHWTTPKQNLTVIVKEKKQRNKKNNQIRIVEREEPCDSFFNFFSPPKEPSSGSDNDDDEDEDEDFYEQQMEMDVEAGQALMEEIVPKAAYYYTGKSIDEVAKELHARFGFGDEDDDEEDEEEEDIDVGGVDFKAVVNRGGRGGGGAAGGRGGAAPQQQECKQQ